MPFRPRNRHRLAAAIPEPFSATAPHTSAGATGLQLEFSPSTHRHVSSSPKRRKASDSCVVDWRELLAWTQPCNGGHPVPSGAGFACPALTPYLRTRQSELGQAILGHRVSYGGQRVERRSHQRAMRRTAVNSDGVTMQLPSSERHARHSGVVGDYVFRNVGYT